jgi:gas vesicle structural protein
MAVERAASGTSLIDVLDRVLDKGIVIDAWVRVSLVGIDLITVEARVVVASIDTYLKYSDAVGQVPVVARPVSIFGSEASSESAALTSELGMVSAGPPDPEAEPPRVITVPFLTRRPPVGRPKRRRPTSH